MLLFYSIENKVTQVQYCSSLYIFRYIVYKTKNISQIDQFCFLKRLHFGLLGNWLKAQGRLKVLLLKNYINKNGILIFLFC